MLEAPPPSAHKGRDMMAGGQQTVFSRALIAAIAALIIAIGLPKPGGAADLAGDCCADLEERIAELESTTVRKGNRKLRDALNYGLHLARSEGRVEELYLRYFPLSFF